MLEELEVRNLGPIRAESLEFGPGMTAITGETGAGKSMLLSAVKLISGGSASGARVAPYADDAWAQGVFETSVHGEAARIAMDAGVLPVDGDADTGAGAGDGTAGGGAVELFLSRRVPVSGRSRAMLEGHLIPQSLLGQVAGELVTIHGQADQMRIASPARQREFLDAASGDEQEIDAYSKAWDALQAADARLKTIMTQEAGMRARADYLRDSLAQIDKVDPKPGEDVELKERRSRIENAEAITHGISVALAALDPSQVVLDSDADSDAVGAQDLINRAVEALRPIRAEGSFVQAADRLESLAADLSDVVYTLSGQIGDDEGAESLDTINARIHELDELMLRWGPELADVIAWRKKASFEMQDLDASPDTIEKLKAERGRLYDAAVRAAKKLSARRQAAAVDLSRAVNGELTHLAMSGAKFEIRVEARGKAVGSHVGTSRKPGRGHATDADDVRGTLKGGDNVLHDEVNEDFTAYPLDSHGMDDIKFLFTPFPGSPQLPMEKSASGGELSRLMLALELSAASKRQAGRPSNGDMTFIFDEVDAGVGGKAAVELGKRLAKLARTSQVIVVTHLAQVASWADAQFVVSKGNGEGMKGAVETTVTKVGGEARVHEIARMLAGNESATSLDHAHELLADSTLQ